MFKLSGDLAVKSTKIAMVTMSWLGSDMSKLWVNREQLCDSWLMWPISLPSKLESQIQQEKPLQFQHLFHDTRLYSG